MPKPSRDVRPSKTNTDSMLILGDATCTTRAAHDGMALSDRRPPMSCQVLYWGCPLFSQFRREPRLLYARPISQ